MKLLRQSGVTVGAALLVLLAPGSIASAAEWTKAESPNFVVYSDVSGDIVKRHVETLELFDAVLHLRLGVKSTEPAARPLPIYLVSKQRSLAKVRPGINETIAGFYLASDDDIYAIAAFERHDMSTIQHEYAHHFMLAKLPSAYPAWLVEGFAEYFATFKHRGGVLEVGGVDPGNQGWLETADWLPYDKILSVRPFQFRDANAVTMYYAQSWALTHYLLSSPERMRELDVYLRAVGSGADPAKAMTDATGLGPVELAKAIRRHLSRFAYQSIRVSDLRLPPVTVEKLPPSAADVLLLTLRVNGDEGVDGPNDKTDGPVLLAEARAAAARHPGDRLADLLQARAEMKLGDMAVADRLLQARLKANPADAEVLQLLAQARLKAADDADDAKAADALRAEARGFAGRAYRGDPNRYQVLLAYDEGRRSVPGFPNENDLKVYIDALDLAPQVDNVRVQAAQVLAHHNRYADAAAVLRPVVFDPHAGPGIGPVREMMTRYEAKAAAAATEAKSGD